ncbi:hypothetical protein EYF80_023222 [Liparis tanakae]|uniref:Uncharacterized protein n=1 Tax=Liparis tanakae TaxID=230148 RepID=A0A4Z2HL52_9TELE|nr:hypothetical protein EYF80_023222 [Liparis tanakae]
MKLYCASWAFLIFLFMVQPGTRSTSLMKPLLWNSCWTCSVTQQTVGPTGTTITWRGESHSGLKRNGTLSPSAEQEAVPEISEAPEERRSRS